MGEKTWYKKVNYIESFTRYRLVYLELKIYEVV